MGLPWFFTKDVREIPDTVKAKIAESAGVDFDGETIVAVCFARTLIKPVRLFVVVTSDRIAAKRADALQITYFSDLIGVERSFTQDIVLRSKGSASSLFSYPELPKKECLDLLYGAINDQFLRLAACGTELRP